MTTPHRHVSNAVAPLDIGADLEPIPLADPHIASSYVQLRDVVCFLIEELDVQPLRDDWRAVLLADEGGVPAE